LAHFSRNPPVIIRFDHAFGLLNDCIQMVLVAGLVSDELITLELSLQQQREKLDLIIGELWVPEI